ncbi:L-threonylcarbamoyladenylate synthase [Cumulibacter soli]|uniref:L-threonylcarbamoyladenylate synthase n=1 Tax=Cumulibacter soli TaxID=2546344 RepID=UPI001068B76C|nr:L-threonylcarbamoyladenylate synthase [Cumulibacter soli]
MARSLVVTDFEILDATEHDSEAYEHAVEQAARTLSDGRLIVLPTDTVYGIAADAFNAPAVGALLAAKGRGRDYPVPVLVADQAVLHGLVTVAPEAAVKLTERFWPGALTVIVTYSPALAWDLGETGGTVGIRMPDSQVARDILARTGPLAVSSANQHGRPPAASVEEATRQLGSSVQVYVDAGHTGGRPASTIVDCTVTPPRIVREGGISREDIRTVVPDIA